MRRKPSKNTVKRARLLENGINSVCMLNFHHFKGKAEFDQYRRRHGRIPSRYIIAPYPCKTIYGTPGKKECFIHADGIGDFIFEAKYQSGSGSVDEKAPYLWESFLATPYHWIVWFDGNWFQKTDRGIAVVKWLRQRAASVQTVKKMHIVNSDQEFRSLCMRLFGQQKPDQATKTVADIQDLLI